MNEFKQLKEQMMKLAVKIVLSQNNKLFIQTEFFIILN